MTEPDNAAPAADPVATAAGAAASELAASRTAPATASMPPRLSSTSTPPQEVLVPGAVYKTIGQLRRGQEQDADVIARAVRWLDTFDTLWSFGNPAEMSFTLMEFAKVSNSQYKMKASGYSDEMASAICRALFCSQADEDFQEAFGFYDRNGNGSIDKAELRAALPLMGENVADDRIDELFTLVDKNENGVVDFAEFCTLVKAMNQKGDPGMVESFRSFSMDGLDLGLGQAVSGTAAAVASSAGQTFSAVSTAWNSNLSISTFSLRQAGSALTKMKEAGADDKTANALVQAYFSGQSKEQLQECFDELDLDKSGYLDKAELQKFLPCMEELSDERFEQMFSQVDKDSSGKVEFEEFRALIKALGEGSWPGVGQMSEAFDKMVTDGWFM